MSSTAADSEAPGSDPGARNRPGVSSTQDDTSQPVDANPLLEFLPPEDDNPPAEADATGDGARASESRGPATRLGDFPKGLPPNGSDPRPPPQTPPRSSRQGQGGGAPLVAPLSPSASSVATGGAGSSSTTTSTGRRRFLPPLRAAEDLTASVSARESKLRASPMRALRSTRADDTLPLAARAKGGDSEAMWALGQKARSEGDVQTAVTWFARAVDRTNHVLSARCLAEILMTGSDSIPKDLPRAARLWMIAAKQGDKHGQFNLGMCLLWGWGVSRDRARGERWLHKAISSGHKLALFRLANYYAGRVVREANVLAPALRLRLMEDVRSLYFQWGKYVGKTGDQQASASKDRAAAVTAAAAGQAAALSEARNEVKRLRSALAKSEAGEKLILEASERARAAEKTLAALRARSRRAEDFERQAAALREQSSSLQDSNKRLEESSRTAQAEAASLRAQVDLMREKMEKGESVMKRGKQLVQAVEASNATLRQEIKSQTADVERLRGVIAEKDRKVLTIQDGSTALRQELKAKTAEVDRLGDLLAEKDQAILALRGENETADAKLSATRKRLTESQDKLIALLKEFRRKNDKNAAIAPAPASPVPAPAPVSPATPPLGDSGVVHHMSISGSRRASPPRGHFAPIGSRDPRGSPASTGRPGSVLLKGEELAEAERERADAMESRAKQLEYELQRARVEAKESRRALEIRMANISADSSAAAIEADAELTQSRADTSAAAARIAEEIKKNGIISAERDQLRLHVDELSSRLASAADELEAEKLSHENEREALERRAATAEELTASLEAQMREAESRNRQIDRDRAAWERKHIAVSRERDGGADALSEALAKCESLSDRFRAASGEYQRRILELEAENLKIRLQLSDAAAAAGAPASRAEQARQLQLRLKSEPPRLISGPKEQESSPATPNLSPIRAHRDRDSSRDPRGSPASGSRPGSVLLKGEELVDAERDRADAMEVRTKQLEDELRVAKADLASERARKINSSPQGSAVATGVDVDAVSARLEAVERERDYLVKSSESRVQTLVSAHAADAEAAREAVAAAQAKIEALEAEITAAMHRETGLRETIAKLKKQLDSVRAEMASQGGSDERAQTLQSRLDAANRSEARLRSDREAAIRAAGASARQSQALRTTNAELLDRLREAEFLLKAMAEQVQVLSQQRDAALRGAARERVRELARVAEAKFSSKPSAEAKPIDKASGDPGDSSNSKILGADPELAETLGIDTQLEVRRAYGGAAKESRGSFESRGSPASPRLASVEQGLEWLRRQRRALASPTASNGQAPQDASSSGTALRDSLRSLVSEALRESRECKLKRLASSWRRRKQTADATGRRMDATEMR